jgi:dTMP kinase
MHPLTELLLFAAGRLQHTEEVITPALQGGEIVISERYLDASTVYQGYGRGLNLEVVKVINQIATGGIKPDLTLVLDIEPRVGLARVGERSPKKDRLEKLSLEFHNRQRDGYLTLAKEEPERIKIIDASGSREEVQARIRKEVEAVLSRRD